MPLSLPHALTRRDGDVVLRDWREDDEAALEPLFAETDRRFSSLPARYSRGAALEHIERLRARREAGELLALAVTRRGVAPVGNVNLVFRFGAGTRQAALGYWMSPPARGQGRGAVVDGRARHAANDGTTWEIVRYSLLPEAQDAPHPAPAYPDSDGLGWIPSS
jgi:hypothetical protein